VLFEHKKKRRKVMNLPRRFPGLNEQLLVVFGLQDFTATIKAVWADMVTHVRFTRGWFDAQLRSDEKVVRAVHAAFRRGFFVLLNSHDNS
jgi:hypothetical protein